MFVYIEWARKLDKVVAVVSLSMALYYLIDAQFRNGGTSAVQLAALWGLSALVSFLSVRFKPAERVAQAVLARRAKVF